jgi:hypothetical protein
MVDLIRAYSNKVNLRDQYADLRKRLQALPFRPQEPARVGPTRALKRRLDRAEIDEIIAKYQAGNSTNQLMAEHRLAKRTISTLLKANGVMLRRQGLTDEQVREASRPRPLLALSNERASSFARAAVLLDLAPHNGPFAHDLPAAPR